MPQHRLAAANARKHQQVLWFGRAIRKTAKQRVEETILGAQVPEKQPGPGIFYPALLLCQQATSDKQLVKV